MSGGKSTSEEVSRTRGSQRPSRRGSLIVKKKLVRDSKRPASGSKKLCSDGWRCRRRPERDSKRPASGSKKLSKRLCSDGWS